MKTLKIYLCVNFLLLFAQSLIFSCVLVCADSSVQVSASAPNQTTGSTQTGFNVTANVSQPSLPSGKICDVPNMSLCPALKILVSRFESGCQSLPGSVNTSQSCDSPPNNFPTESSPSVNGSSPTVKPGELTCYSCRYFCDNETEEKCKPQDDMCVDARYNDGDMDKGCANEKDYQTTWKKWSDFHGGNKGDVIKCYENLCNNKIRKHPDLTCYFCKGLCENETERKCKPQYEMCVDARYNDGHIEKGCTNEKDYQTIWKKWSDSHGGNKVDDIKCYENLCNNKTTKHDLTCYFCKDLCENETERKCKPQYDMCVDARYNDGHIEKGCTNEKDYQTIWKKWSDSHGGNKVDDIKCYENLCNNKTTKHDLTCYFCKDLCENETERKCKPQYDMCVDARYNDGHIEKGCTNENDYQTIWKKWSDSHGGNKVDDIKCYENLCNNKTTKHDLTCYFCKDLCENETERKCKPQYDMCVDARYNDGHIEKGCTNEKDYQTIWKKWSDSHGGNKVDDIKCYENLCNNKTTKYNLTCYSCNQLCENESEKKCKPQDDMCVDVRYNDGNIDKGCANEKDYQTTWKEWSDSHNGIKGDAIKCYENLCNNKTTTYNLTCYSCNQLCENETEKKCKPQDNMCVDVRYNDGNMDKGCANEKEYQTTWKEWSDSHGGNKGDAHKCYENLCNN